MNFPGRGSIAAGTNFEQGGGLRNITGGGCWSHDKSDARNYDPKAHFWLIKFLFIHYYKQVCLYCCCFH